MNCRVCSSESGSASHTFREMMFGFRDEFEYLECSACQCLQIVSIPASMTKYYPAEYHSFAPMGPRSRIRKAIVRRRNIYAVSGRDRVGKLLSRWFPPDPALASLAYLRLEKSMRILDVGCGSGLLLNMLGDLGFRHLLGIDPFLPQTLEHENGVRLVKTTIHDIAGEFDVIMFHHVLEHLADPVSTLQAARALLAPGGHCLVRVPVSSSYAWRHYGTNWVQLDAPRHLYIHSPKSLQILTDRAGLELTNVMYDSTSFQFWGSEQYAADIPLHDSRSYSVSPEASMFSRGQIAVFERRAAELNRAHLGDQAIFYLRKPSDS